MAGCDRVISYEPTTGDPLWEADPTTNECVGSIVIDDDLAFASGGYPELQTVAVRTDGSGEVVWSNRVKIYVPSMLAHDGRLFGFTDDGIAFCWDGPTGDVVWKKRLGGVFNSSPVLVGGKIFVVREDGTCFVLDATADRYKSLAENKIGDEVYATPTFLGSRVYMRVAEIEADRRQEFLYCLGKERRRLRKCANAHECSPLEWAFTRRLPPRRRQHHG